MRELLSQKSQQFSLSLQTYFAALEILMSWELPEMCNQDPDVVLAALFISHKLHDVHLVSVAALCEPDHDYSSVLAM